MHRWSNAAGLPQRAASPVAHMVRVAVAGAATGKAATAVPSRERPAEGRRHRPRLPPHVQHSPVWTVADGDPGGVTRQPPRRLRGNVRTIFKDRLSCGIVPFQHPLVDMNNHLVPVSGCAPVEVGGQGTFGHEPERVGPPLAGHDLRGGPRHPRQRTHLRVGELGPRKTRAKSVRFPTASCARSIAMAIWPWL